MLSLMVWASITQHPSFNLIFRFTFSFQLLRNTPYSESINSSWVWRRQQWSLVEGNPWLILLKVRLAEIQNLEIQGLRRWCSSLLHACFCVKIQNYLLVRFHWLLYADLVWVLECSRVNARTCVVHDLGPSFGLLY